MFSSNHFTMREREKERELYNFPKNAAFSFS